MLKKIVEKYQTILDRLADWDFGVLETVKRPKKIKFLSKKVSHIEPLEIHEVLMLYKLMHGKIALRDRGLLESAVFNAKYYIEEGNIFRVAARIVYGIAKNHPFVDGNKRAAAVSALWFLEKNGVVLEIEDYEAFADLVIFIAGGRMDDEEAAKIFVKA